MHDEVVVPSDAELIVRVRSGDTAAFGELYTRHAEAAKRLAAGLERDHSDRDDLVAEAFAKVLATMSTGRGGPDVAFRPYLLTTLRHAWYSRIRNANRFHIHSTDDIERHLPPVHDMETVIARAERDMAARAFAKLPERWRMVLWHTEIEGETPAQIAPLLGLTPNGVAALAYRARERLRQMYLQEHLNDTGDPDCRWTIERLGGYVRSGLSPRDQSKVTQHLRECAACRQLHAELAEVNTGLLGIFPSVAPDSCSQKYAWLSGPAAGRRIWQRLRQLLARIWHRR